MGNHLLCFMKRNEGKVNSVGRKKGSKSDARIKKVGAKLRKLRKSSGYSSYDSFAYEIGINRTQVGNYESGKDMLLSSFFKMLDGLSVTPQEFFKDF